MCRSETCARVQTPLPSESHADPPLCTTPSLTPPTSALLPQPLHRTSSQPYYGPHRPSSSSVHSSRYSLLRPLRTVDAPALVVQRPFELDAARVATDETAREESEGRRLSRL